MKENFKRFLNAIIPVVTGILIALFINNWNEHRKDKNYIEQFYTSLKKQLEETDKEITDKIPFQEALQDTIETYIMQNDVSIIEIIEKAGGVKGPIIKLNYWKALSNSKIELLEYDKLSVLADIEEGNELLKFKRNKLLEFIYSNMTENEKNKKIKFKYMVIELIVTEKNVQADIRKILTE